MKKDYRKKFIVGCSCGGFHYLEVSKWEDEKDTYIFMINADNNAPFFKRIKEAIKYIFGKYLCYHDVILNEEDTKKLKQFLKTL